MLGLVPGRGSDSSIHLHVQTCSGTQQLYLMGIHGSFSSGEVTVAWKWLTI